MTQEELVIRLTELDARSRRNEGRIHDLEDGQEALRKLATSVEVLAGELRHQTTRLAHMEQGLESLDGKVGALEQRPGRRWEAVAEKLILVLASALVTYVLTQLGLA